MMGILGVESILKTSVADVAATILQRCWISCMCGIILRSRCTVIILISEDCFNPYGVDLAILTESSLNKSQAHRKLFYNVIISKRKLHSQLVR